MRQVSHPEPALGSTIFVTTRPFETIRADATTDELSLRIERDGLIMPLVWILMVSVALGLFVQLIFPHLPWGNAGVLTKVTSIAWFVSGFSLTLLLTIFSINLARSRPGFVLLRLTRSPDGVRCMQDASETTLAAPTITIGPERDLLADMHRRGVAVNPLRRDVVLLRDPTTRVAIYSAGNPKPRQQIFDPVERWLQSDR